MSKVMRWIPNIRDPYTLFLMIRDPRSKPITRIIAIVIIGLIAAYTISPIDAIPDTIPVLGWLDDLLMIPVGMKLAEFVLPAEVYQDSKNTANRRVNKTIKVVVLGGIAVFILWAVSFIAAVILIINLIKG